MFLGILVIIGVACYFMSAEERARALQTLRFAIERAYETAQGGPANRPFPTALRERTPWAIVTPTLIVLNVAAFAMMAAGANPDNEAETLVAWGANLAPHTTNGEWQRLVTSTFVHASAFQLLVNVAGLAALGFITERLVGPFTFAMVYLTAGVFASLVSLSVNPLVVGFGASGAILGIYGLLVAFGISIVLRRADLELPPSIVLKRLGGVAGVFVLYNMIAGSLMPAAELSGFAVGLVHGLFVMRGTIAVKPAMRRIAATTAAILLVSTSVAARLSGIDDVRPEVESLIAIEQRTSGQYDVEVERYKTRKGSENGLVQLIDGRILPELQATAARLNALDHILPEQQPLIESARAYLRLREESWRLRADGLRKMFTLRSRGGGRALQTSSTLALMTAETRERAALDALQVIVTATTH